jgi:hypothetical protein
MEWAIGRPPAVERQPDTGGRMSHIRPILPWWSKQSNPRMKSVLATVVYRLPQFRHRLTLLLLFVVGDRELSGGHTFGAAFAPNLELRKARTRASACLSSP